MYRFLGLITGAVIAVMVAINGVLTGHYGLFTATVLLHIVGFLVALLVLRFSGRRMFPDRRLPGWMYWGGLIGVLVAVFNNFAFGKISMTAIVALGLFGQASISVLIDQLGLFGVPRRPFSASTLAGLLFSLAGIAFMLAGVRGSALLALWLSIGSGICVVLSRMINARLAVYSGALGSSFINHLTGLVGALAVLMLLGRGELPLALSIGPAPWWAYVGGGMGVLVVLLCNVTVPRVPAFSLTLLTFTGQVFAGIAIDLFLGQGYSQQTFYGGLLVATGIVLSLVLERYPPGRNK